MIAPPRPFAPERPDERATAIRAAVCLVWLVVLLQTPFEHYDSLPRQLFDEVGFLLLLREAGLAIEWVFLPGVLGALKLAALAGCAIGLVWRHAPRALLLATASLVWFLDAVTKSLQAYPNHAQVVPLLILLIVACRSRRRSSHASTGIVWLSALAIVVPYTFIAVNRILRGGIAIFAGDSVANSMMLASYYHPPFGFQVLPALMAVTPFAPFVRLTFVAVTIVELTSIGTLLSRRWRTLWLFSITLFHLSSLVLSNIFFWENLLLIWAVFGPLPTGALLSPREWLPAGLRGWLGPRERV